MKYTYILALNSNFESVVIRYIPGPSNIFGNEMVDTVAKDAHTTGQLIPTKLSIKDASKAIKGKLWLERSLEYVDIGATKGRHYMSINPQVIKSNP